MDPKEEVGVNAIKILIYFFRQKKNCKSGLLSFTKAPVEAKARYKKKRKNKKEIKNQN